MLTKLVMTPMDDSCIFLIHSEVDEFLSIISKYTPANPDVTLPHNTDKKPIILFLFISPVVVLSLCDCDSCTNTTPEVRVIIASHCIREICFDNIITLNTAVVTIFI